MNCDELMMEDCRATWRADAHAKAEEDIKDSELHGEAAEVLLKEREATYYAEWERIALEDIP